MNEAPAARSKRNQIAVADVLVGARDHIAVDPRGAVESGVVDDDEIAVDGGGGQSRNAADARQSDLADGDRIELGACEPRIDRSGLDDRVRVAHVRVAGVESRRNHRAVAEIIVKIQIVDGGGNCQRLGSARRENNRAAFARRHHARGELVSHRLAFAVDERKPAVISDRGERLFGGDERGGAARERDPIAVGGIVVFAGNRHAVDPRGAGERGVVNRDQVAALDDRARGVDGDAVDGQSVDAESQSIAVDRPSVEVV